MIDRQDFDMIAAEYVIGTLDTAERTEVESLRHQEPDLDAAIAAWEGRLDPLNAHAVAVEPPDKLFSRIEARLDDGIRSAPSVRAEQALVVDLRRRVTRWRAGAAAAAALAACLAVALLVREIAAPLQPTNFVAVFNENDERPAFVLSIDLATREVVIRPVGAQRQAGKTYQLWIVAKPTIPVPRSLGLLDGSLGPTRKRLADFEPGLLQNATFGISLEPEGGSPTGQPTGPALHGTLIPATP